MITTGVFAAALLIFLPIAGAAALPEKPTNLYVNGQDILSPGKENAVSGASYDRAANLLTLDNVSITEGYALSGYVYGICTDSRLNIELKGKNSINMLNHTNGAAILTLGDLSISGDGSLKTDSFFGLDAEQNLTVTDCKIYTDSTTFSFFSLNDMTLRNCSVTGTSKSNWCFVCYGGNLTVENSMVTARGVVGLYANYGDMTFSESGVSAVGFQDGIAGYGNITILSGNVSAKGPEAAIVAIATNADFPENYIPGKTAVNPFELRNETRPAESPRP